MSAHAPSQSVAPVHSVNTRVSFANSVLFRTLQDSSYITPYGADYAACGFSLSHRNCRMTPRSRSPSASNLSIRICSSDIFASLAFSASLVTSLPLTTPWALRSCRDKTDLRFESTSAGMRVEASVARASLVRDEEESAGLRRALV